MTSLAFHLGFLLAAALLGSVASVDEDYGELKLVHLLYRHGDRTPIDFYPNDPYQDPKYWPVGPGELLNAGKERQYELGEFLKKRYEGFLSPMYSIPEVYVRSTDYDRTLMSAQANLAGLFPPQGSQIWNPNISWQPIPVHTVSPSDDYLLSPDSTCRTATDELESLKYRLPFVGEMVDRAEKLLMGIQADTGLTPHGNVISQVDYLSDTLKIELLRNDAPCPAAEQALDDAHRLPEVQALEKKYKGLLEYLNQHTHANFTSILDWRDLNSILFIESSFNYTLPNWTHGIYPNQTKPISDFSFMLKSLTPTLKRLRGGPLVYTMVKNMEDKVARKSRMEKLKVVMYSGHDTTVSMFLGSLNIFDPHQPGYACLVTVELREKNAVHYARVMYRNETGDYNLRIPGCGHMCRLEEFARLTEPVRISPQQWGIECQNQPSIFSSNLLLVVNISCLLVVLLILSTTLLVLYWNKHRQVRGYTSLPSADAS